MIDRKGVTSFLAITFGVAYAIEGALIASGMPIGSNAPGVAYVVTAGVMWVPTLATLVTIKWVTRESLAITNLRFGSWKPYAVSAVVVPAAYCAIYGLTWLLQLGQPDWQLASLRRYAVAAGADPSIVPPPSMLLPATLLATLLISPWINGIFGFGEEFGWRGYLLPKLLPLGKWKAYLLAGMIWGVWHAPLIMVGFNYPGYPILGVLGMAGITTALSVYINELTLRHQSSILAGWIHGLINSQSYGIWRMLVPNVNPLLGGSRAWSAWACGWGSGSGRCGAASS